MLIKGLMFKVQSGPTFTYHLPSDYLLKADYKQVVIKCFLHSSCFCLFSLIDTNGLQEESNNDRIYSINR